MSQKKHIPFVQPQGAPAGFSIPQFIAKEPVNRNEYVDLSTSTAQVIPVHKNASFVRLQAKGEAGVYVSLSETVAKGNTVPATQTLTSTGAIANNDTVTIGTRVYTFKTTLTGAANEVLLGANAAAALDNLKLAINGGAGAGIVYGTGTVAHEDVIATTNSDTTQVILAREAGTSGNSIATTVTGANIAWGAAAMAGGTATGTWSIYIPANQTVDVGADETLRVMSALAEDTDTDLVAIQY